jgi:hypothetical protein|nr:MAG TPA: Putative transferase, nesg, ydcK, Structural Genomics.38A [Caudoviricetes sp.]
MGSKKYEIITVGSDKRVRALRSWQVGDRYVNIGDVGGIVYDEKTLSQDGACWLFRGNFNFPGARIGGDSVVDVGEAALSATGTPAVGILGSSVVVGSKLRFASEQTAADAVALGANDFEQGGFNYAAGANWETMKAASASYIRSKALIFSGGVPVTVKCAVEGYAVTWYTTDADGITTGAASSQVVTGAGVSFTIPAGQYFFIRLRKEPTGTIVPADATAAQIKFTGTHETKLVIVDSRVEINPVTATAEVALFPGGQNSITSGIRYPDSIIQDSSVVINGAPNAPRAVRLMSEFISVNATIDAATADAQAVGIYHGVNNLAFSGSHPGIAFNAQARSLIQAYNCGNMVVNTTNFPGLAAMQTAGVPIRFYKCNLNNGRFYHHAQIANTYRDINFDLATADLGKINGAGHFLISSEVNGMYRLSNGTIITALVESHESVKSVASSMSDAYNTTIYADAYLSGKFDLKGTNVFGNSMKHEAGNTQDISGVLVKGLYNAATNGSTISGVVANNASAVVLRPFRISGGGGVSVDAPAGVECNIYLTDSENKILSNTGYVPGINAPAALARTAIYAYVAVRKADGSDILSLDEVKGVTVTTYNGCRIVSTKATGAMIYGNVRVEDNATLIDTSVTGTGYFGGNSIVQAPSALAGQLPIAGAAYMSGNAVFAPFEANASAGLSLLDMRDNAVFAGRLGGAGKYNITMAGNARFFGSHNSGNAWVLGGNSYVAPAAVVNASCEGVSIMEGNARIESGSITTTGYVTLCGKYKQTASKVWTGKRVIASQDAPAYDDNVKTEYDF